MENYEKEMYEELDVMLANQERINIRLIKALLTIKGFDWVASFCKDFKESECNGDISFAKTPKGSPQSDYWGAIKGVYVDQHCEMYNRIKALKPTCSTK